MHCKIVLLREERRGGGEHDVLDIFFLLCCSVCVEFGSNFIAGAVLLTKRNVRHQIFVRQKIEVFLLLSVSLLCGTQLI